MTLTAPTVIPISRRTFQTLRHLANLTNNHSVHGTQVLRGTKPVAWEQDGQHYSLDLDPVDLMICTIYKQRLSDAQRRLEQAQDDHRTLSIQTETLVQTAIQRAKEAS